MSDETKRLGTLPLAMLLLLRLAIGWHFLYEGVTKLMNPDWTSAGFLAESRWLLSGVFHWLLESPALIRIVDLLNMWGLTLIGLALILGVFLRPAAISGMVLLALYYVANPPLIGLDSGMVTEGSYLWVDKNLVELLALGVIAALPTSRLFGVDRLISSIRKRIPSPEKVVEVGRAAANPDRSELDAAAVKRRELIKALATAPLLGGFVFGVLKKRGWDSYEERHLLAAGANVDTVSSATVKTFQYSSLQDLKGELPYGQIGDLKLSRLFLGGNLMGGWAHARDLIYVSKLVKSYHTDEKVFETFRLAELCGVNTILTNPALCRVINEYWRRRGGKIQFISDCALGGDLFKGIDVSVEGGADACYVQGGIADQLAAEGKVDEIGEALERIRKHGVPAGIGGHALDTVKTCVEAGLKPDFWVKTLHHCNYWSADKENQNDNIWCTEPEETVRYMEQLEEPWIAFKVLAAGAIEPEEGFRYAFHSGADFICVGMYDFQIVDDVNLACSILEEPFERGRPWRA